jgi:ABC-type protease/lipase transport system fused ATPase/permease subunit
MSWLYAAQPRPFVLLASAASLLLNLCLLVPSIDMLQVFDRVFASRSVPTLVMLSVLALLALVLAYCMDTARARSLSRAGCSMRGCRRRRWCRCTLAVRPGARWPNWKRACSIGP